MSIQIQKQIKDNVNDLRQYISQLKDWEEEMEIKQKIKKGKYQPPIIHQSKQPQNTNQINQQFKQLKRDVNTIADYYNAWSKFDIDQQIEQIESGIKPYNPYDKAKGNIRAKPKTQLIIKGKRNAPVADPTNLKQKGNIHFRSCQYKQAIQCYSQSIKLMEGSNPKTELIITLYSNRAMAYLKINQIARAQQDCDKVLSLQPTHVKTLMRRGIARKRLKKWKLALKDFEQAVKYDKNSTQALHEKKQLQSKIENIQKQAHENLILQKVQNSLRLRIEIQDVQEQDQQIQQQNKNYLQQL